MQQGSLGGLDFAPLPFPDGHRSKAEGGAPATVVVDPGTESTSDHFPIQIGHAAQPLVHSPGGLDFAPLPFADGHRSKADGGEEVAAPAGSTAALEKEIGELTDQEAARQRKMQRHSSENEAVRRQVAEVIDKERKAAARGPLVATAEPLPLKQPVTSTSSTNRLQPSSAREVRSKTDEQC